MEIILASKSPRRRELIAKLFPEFSVITVEVDETLSEGVHPKEGVGLLAVRKGEAVALEHPEALVISSDTLVEKDGKALGKPSDEGDAFEMLKQLSGCSHNVHTGVAVHYKDAVLFGVDTTEVTFKTLTDSQIKEYIASGEPMDKAGAYGIQGLGGAFVAEYKGNYDTVVGLSLSLVESLVNKALEKEDAEND